MRDLKLLLKTISFSLLFFSFWANAQTKPNIVIIVADDVGYADTYWNIPERGGADGYEASESEADGGANGYVAEATTNLAQLASENWFFNNAYITGNTCAPTRAGLLSGLYQQRSGVYASGDGGQGIPNSVLTIPRHLGDAYDKMAIGKWHMGEIESDHSPAARGFDHFFGYLGKGSHDYWAMTDEEYSVNNIEGERTGQYIESNSVYYYTHADALAADVDFEDVEDKDGDDGYTFDKDYNEMLFEFKGQNMAGAGSFYNVDDSDYTEGLFAIPSHDRVYHNKPETQTSERRNLPGGVYMSELLTNQAKRFIKNVPLRNNHPEDGLPREEGKPFLLYLGYTAVHTDNTVPKEWHDEWIQKVPENDPDNTVGNSWDKDERASLMAMMDNMDDGIGEIVQLLKDEGEWENTVFVFLSDNGGASGMIADAGSLRANKQWNFEGGIRTPFIFSWPAQHPTNNRGRVIDTRISSLDIFPTIVKAANIGNEEPATDGKSILPLLVRKENRQTHEDARPRHMFFSEGAEKIFRGEKLYEFAVIDNQENKKLYAQVIGDNGDKDDLGTPNRNNRGKIAFWLFDMNKGPEDTGFSDTEGYESDLLDLVDDNAPYHTNTELIEMLRAYEEWLAPMPNPIKEENAKGFYPIIGLDLERFPEDSGVILRVYDDVYYNGTATSYDQTDEGDLLNFSQGDVHSLVVAPGYVATLTNSNDDKMQVSGTGKPLLLNSFYGDVVSIVVGEGYSNCSGKINVDDQGAAADNGDRGNPENLVDNTVETRWQTDNKNAATLTFTFCEELTFNGIRMNYKTSSDVVQYANVIVNGTTVFKGYDPSENIYVPSEETISAFILETGLQTTDEVIIEVYAHDKGDGDPLHEQNSKPDILEVEFLWSESTLSNNNVNVSNENMFKVWNKGNYLNISHSSIMKKLDIISLTGQTMFTYHNANSTILEINKSNLSSGLYLIKATTIDNREIVKKAIIE